LIRDKYNIIPAFLAAIFHVLVFGGLVVAIDFTKPAYPAVPLAITANLITEADLPEPPPVEEPEPEPEPEPDTSEQDRLREEEAKRQADMREEQERIRLEEEADRKNQRLREEAEAAEMERRRQAELEAEDMRLAALSASDEARWAFAIQQQITRNFIRPASAPVDLECVVDVRQLPGGQVVNVDIGRCNGDESVRRSIEAAVFKASPLPSPDNPTVFTRDLRIIFKPEQ
jgi:colicin import membrane protein